MEVVLRQTSQRKRKVSSAAGGWLFGRFSESREEGLILQFLGMNLQSP